MSGRDRTAHLVDAAIGGVDRRSGDESRVGPEAEEEDQRSSTRGSRSPRAR